MKPVLLSMSDPRVASLVADVSAMQRWEVLRRSDAPMTAEELAAACRTSLSTMQFTLDRLVDAGFAVKVRASAAKKRITYRSAAKDVVVRFDSGSQTERESAWCSLEASTRHLRGVIDRARNSPAIRSKSLRWCDSKFMPVLTYEESCEILQLLMSTAQKVEEIEARAFQRAIADPASNKLSRTRGYCVNLVLQPLEQPELPLGQMAILGDEIVARRLEHLERSPSNLLSPRAQEIARRLAAGESRPAIAKALGLSPHTVAATCKRIYAKLGVHSRAELASRILGS